VASPSRLLTRSASSLNVSLELEHHQIVYPHTISSVLNDPTVKHPVFVEPNIAPSPHLVDAPLASYKPYLQQTHEVYSRLQEQRKSRRDQARADTHAPEEEAAAEPGPAQLLAGHARGSLQKAVIDSRKVVPEHYFDEKFDLSAAATFYRTFYDGTPHKELAEKIDSYLELVERDLTDKLNKRSDAFFRALRDMQALHLLVAASHRTMQELKDNLQIADDELVVKSLDIVNKKTKKSNFQKVQKMMRLLQAVSRSIPKVERLIEQENYFDALETIRSAEQAMKSDLKGAACLEGFQAKLERYNKIVRGHLSAQFVEEACGSDVLLPEATLKLRPLIVEMQSIGQLISTLETYSEIQQQNIKKILPNLFMPSEVNPSSSPQVPSHSRSDSLSRSSSSSSVYDTPINGITVFNEFEERSMKAYEQVVSQIEMDEFLLKLQGILSSMLDYVVRIKEVHHLIDQVFKDLAEKEKKDITEMMQILSDRENGISSNGSSDMNDGAPVVTREEIAALEAENQLQKRLRTQISIDSGDMVFGAAELANTLIARLLRVRSDQHSRMPVQEFANFYNMVASFVKNVDKQVGRPCPTLRVVLNSQAKTMFADWDKRMCVKLSHTLNAENWARAEIAAEFAAILHCLYTPKQSIHTLDATKEVDNAKSLNLGNERFTLVNSELIFVKLLYDYLIFLDTLPHMYSEVISKIGEAINLWSKLTYGLVLKQGAVENQMVAGNINVGHLSLASNCLGVQLVLIPRIKERVLAYIQDAAEISILSCLDKSTEECTTHQQEIYSKMITTMRNRVDSCFKMYKVDEATDKINPAVTKLMEATQKMHKILKTYLSPNTFKTIFKQIIAVYNNQIKSHISTLTIKTPKEKAKLLNDVHHILSELRALDGVDDPTDDLTDFVHERFKV
jgi:vacuolar protein sorting-associated protein 54